MITERGITAMHEAAHAVVAYHHGWVQGGITISTTEEEDSKTAVHGPHRFAAKLIPSLRKQSAELHLAGVAIEYMVASREGPVSEDAMNEIWSHAAPDVEQFIWLYKDQATAEADIWPTIERVAKILAQRRKQWQRLTRRLVQADALSAEEVHFILRRRHEPAQGSEFVEGRGGWKEAEAA